MINKFFSWDVLGAASGHSQGLLNVFLAVTLACGQVLQLLCSHSRQKLHQELLKCEKEIKGADLTPHLNVVTLLRLKGWFTFQKLRTSRIAPYLNVSVRPLIKRKYEMKHLLLLVLI